MRRKSQKEELNDMMVKRYDGETDPKKENRYRAFRDG